MFHVVTYNLLSSSYGTHTTFPHNAPHHLDVAQRWVRLCNKLERCLQSRAVVCLQEVCLTWLLQLQSLFQQYGYWHLADNYGKPASGHMGVVLAVPMDQFLIESSQVLRIGALLQAETMQVSGDVVIPDNDWTEAMQRANGALAVTLRSRVDPLCSVLVATYHMPCSYQTHTVVAAHAKMLLEQLERLAGTSPFVLAGDFNVCAYSPIYNALLSSTASASLAQLITHDTRLYSVPWAQSVLPSDGRVKLQSAYASVLGGAEPRFTTHCQSAGSPAPFTNTLDYIFFRQGFRSLCVRNIEALPREPTSLLPNDCEGSDHLLLGAQFEFL